MRKSVELLIISLPDIKKGGVVITNGSWVDGFDPVLRQTSGSYNNYRISH